tara:strand:+ start:903 stop:1070 length:168 start_codon:yes stop_codon:yes gene_type:complete
LTPEAIAHQKKNYAGSDEQQYKNDAGQILWDLGVISYEIVTANMRPFENQSNRVV